MGDFVGTVVELARYPVKSMAGELVSAAQVDWQGIEGDRQFSFFRLRDTGRFPWLTARDLPDLVRHRARFRDPDLPRHSRVDVQTPDGQWFDLEDERLLARLSDLAGAELALLPLGRGTHDSMPISLVSSATHDALDSVRGSPLDRRRFRSNIVIEGERPEGEWRGRRLDFGGWPDSAELAVADAIPRCVMVTIDPDDAARDPSVMRLVVEQFSNEIGVYATASRPGTIRVGDRVTLSG